jgi:auxin-responsive protein IAA
MSAPLELDYIGLSTAACGRADDDLKGTKPRLGLPGCESLDRCPTVAAATALELLPAKGAKHGFSNEVVPPAPAGRAITSTLILPEGQLQ